MFTLITSVELYAGYSSLCKNTEEKIIEIGKRKNHLYLQMAWLFALKTQNTTEKWEFTKSFWYGGSYLLRNVLCFWIGRLDIEEKLSKKSWEIFGKI